MNIKIVQIYNLVLNGLKTKNELAKILNVTTKTIENYMKQINSEIKYSKKLGKYHFIELLPKKITYSFIQTLIIDNFNNQILQHDYNFIQQSFTQKYDDLIETKHLSEQLKNLIIFNIAINHNITLSINYKLNEKKIIQPNQIIKIKDLYYVYVTYDKRNKININEERTLCMIDISDISFVEYSQILVYKMNFKGNEYGKYSSNKYILLTLTGDAATFFKRNKITYLKWDFISESNDTKFLYIKLFYNTEIEIKRLIQQWLPYISFTERNSITRKILNEIQNDIQAILN